MAAELHPAPAVRDAERFVDHRVIVHECINAVTPLAMAPAIGGEQFLDFACRVLFAINIDCTLVDERWQRCIVRNRAVVFKNKGKWRVWHGLMATANDRDRFPHSAWTMRSCALPAASSRQSGSRDSGYRADPATLQGDTAPRTPACPLARCRNWSRRTATHGSVRHSLAASLYPRRSHDSSR